MRIKTIFLFFAFSFQLTVLNAQFSAPLNTSEIYMQLKKLQVLGSVLYIAAHPDDENNGLLPYLAKEKLYRTAYLSLTRGDGGQNLIGPEQGVELGLIRTQELLGARRIDGAEQYFSRAYEFGFSKSSEEALRIWGREKILSDVVWVIRKYQPDVIIKRFPPDARAGHGHHAASAILADEAFAAAADASRFPEQFKFGVKPWQAKRIVWNTFNFGANNTTSNDQLKINVGGFNPLIAKSYGELGGEARSMHKSQGEGRPRRRGEIIEYFTTTGGEPAKTDLMDGVNADWSRINGGGKVEASINEIINNYNFQKPELSVPALVKLYQTIQSLAESNWRNEKLHETQEIIEACSGLFTEATTNQETVVQGGQLNVSFFFNKRGAVDATVKSIRMETLDSLFSKALGVNENVVVNKVFPVANDKKLSQPYWLEYPQTEGAFEVKDQQLIGKAENDPPYTATFIINIAGVDFTVTRPVQYKVVDPAKGELYQPLVVLPKVEVSYAKDNFISLNGKPVQAGVHFLSNINDSAAYDFQQKYSSNWNNNNAAIRYVTSSNPDFYVNTTFTPTTKSLNTTETTSISSADGKYYGYRKTISYDHIPTITYFPQAKANLVKPEIKIVGKRVGYIIGAGDKVAEALVGMGYEVTFLQEADITFENLKRFDAIVVGIRAHNIFEYLTNKNDILNQYVENGGNLVLQYIKSNQVGLKRIKVGPYPFTISPSLRVTQENAKVDFILPQHSALNYPNKITEKDFEGWVQERSTYQVDQSDEHFEKLISMNDAGEKENNGSLVIAKYGKGNFAYVSLVLFRQLPAGVPGAYRLMANLIALPKNK